MTLLEREILQLIVIPTQLEPILVLVVPCSTRTVPLSRPEELDPIEGVVDQPGPGRVRARVGPDLVGLQKRGVDGWNLEIHSTEVGLRGRVRGGWRVYVVARKATGG